MSFLNGKCKWVGLLATCLFLCCISSGCAHVVPMQHDEHEQQDGQVQIKIADLVPPVAPQRPADAHLINGASLWKNLRGQITSVKNPYGGVFEFQYDSNHVLEHVRTSNGSLLVRVGTPDLDHWLLVHPDQHYSALTVHIQVLSDTGDLAYLFPVGHISVIGSSGFVVEMSMIDGQWYINTTRGPDGSTCTIAYDGVGKPVYIQDFDGTVLVRQVDGHWHLTIPGKIVSTDITVTRNPSDGSVSVNTPGYTIIYTHSGPLKVKPM